MNIRGYTSAHINLQRHKPTERPEHTNIAVSRRDEQLNTEAEDTQPAASDSVEISVKSRREPESFEEKLQKMRDEWNIFKQQLDHAIEQGEGAAEGWKIKIQCLRIALRIMSGDNVPKEDHRFLAKHDIELYTKAISMRMEKEDPEDFDRISEDEESDEAGNEAESTSSASVETPSGDAAESTAEEATAE